MRLVKSFTVLVPLIVLVAGSFSTAQAQINPDPFILTPNGNPTGPSSADSPTYIGLLGRYYYTVSIPGATSHLFWPDSPSFLDVLAAQGYSAANGWTINTLNLSGNIRLDMYQAWAENAPAFNQGALAFAGLNRPGNGGAEIGLHYVPMGTDPTGDSVHWLQIVITNDPANNAVGVKDSGGSTWYLDDVGNPANYPFYDPIGTANSTDFMDDPNRPYNNNLGWRAYTFIGTEDLATKTLNISGQGVSWGFDDPVHPVPEPNTLVLSVSGALSLLLLWLL